MAKGLNQIRAMNRRKRREMAAAAEKSLGDRLAAALAACNAPASESLALQQHIGLGMRDATAEEINEACAAWERNWGHL